MASDLAQEIRDLGMKPTPQRLGILRALKDNMDRHPSLSELHAKVRERMPTVSFSTLYNTISALDKAGYIRLFDLGGETRVEMNPSDHINIIDQRTGMIIDIDDKRVVNRVLESIDRSRIQDRKVMINVIIY